MLQLFSIPFQALLWKHSGDEKIRNIQIYSKTLSKQALCKGLNNYKAIKQLL